MEKRKSKIMNHFGENDAEDICQHAIARGTQVYCLELAFKGKPGSLCPYVYKNTKNKCPYRGPVPW